jgi:hypothetical protein
MPAFQSCHKRDTKYLFKVDFNILLAIRKLLFAMTFLKEDFAFISNFLQTINKLSILPDECKFMCLVECDISELGVRNTEMAALPE